MRLSAVQRILGQLLMLFSLTMLAPAALSAWFADGETGAFATGLGVALLAGFFIWLPARQDARELRLRDGFLVAAVFWIGLGCFGAVPLLLTDRPDMSFTDAVFETVSGLTTTGATALTGLDSLPRSILYYRAQLHWLGGMGIIILAVAILPMLGVGGMQIYRSGTPGPLKDSRLTPRIMETAKALWLIYVGLTAACAGAYWYAGMGVFDALCHSFSTLGTGAFSTHDGSLGYFHSGRIEAVAMVFMVLAGASFSLHFLAFRTRGLSPYRHDPEFRTYILALGILTAGATAALYLQGAYPGLPEAARAGAFQFVSFMTSTGFVTAEFQHWPGALPLMLILVSFIGGCAGSTAGGMKVVRWLLLYNLGVREIRRLVHPAAEIPVRLGVTVIPQRVVDAVWGFCVTYIFVFGILLLVLVGNGLDQVTAFSALATSINNMGPGLGLVVDNFTRLDDLDKWVCIVAMLVGRLEVFTILVLFSPGFWRS